jgi:squalene monooxygenase
LNIVFPFLQPVASTINTLAGALYKVFCASPDPARKEMRQACFDYLSLGGVFSTGPVSLLSGLNPRPLSLVLHFFAVAVFGVGRLLVPFPSPKRIWIGARLISVCISIHHFVFNQSPLHISFSSSAYIVLIDFCLLLRDGRIMKFSNLYHIIFIFQGASGIIFPIIKAEGVRQMFFPATVPAYHRAPPIH